MTSQEKLAKIGQAALDAKTEGLGLPPRVSEAIRLAEESEVVLPTAPGLYLMQVAGKPDRTALLNGSGIWHMDGLSGSSTNRGSTRMRQYLLGTGRRPERIYTATEAQKMAADAVDLAMTKTYKSVRRVARKIGQREVINYIDSMHQPRYSALLGELAIETGPLGSLYVGDDE